MRGAPVYVVLRHGSSVPLRVAGVLHMQPGADSFVIGARRFHWEADHVREVRYVGSGDITAAIAQPRRTMQMG